MDVQKIVEDAWSKTIEAFKNAEKSGEVGLWTEATLRLNFIRHLSKSAELGRILAETPFHFEEVDYKPDIIADVIANNDKKRVVFELKLYGQNWKEDLVKLDKYSIMGWHLGYFLAIGYPQQCEEIQKQPIEKSPLSHYEVKILTHSAPKANVVPDFKFAADVLKMSIEEEVPYVVNEIGFPGAFAFYEGYTLIFDMMGKENKLVLRAEIDNKSHEEQKIKKLGYPYIDFDEEGKIHPSSTFTGDILIGEFDFRGMNSKQVAKSIKEPLQQFMEKMDAI
jgi:hypothetical protein